MEDSDPIAIARALAAVVRHEAPAMVFAGVQSSDHAHGATGIALAGLLDWPHCAVVAGLDYDAGASEAVVRRDCSIPFRIYRPGINKPRYASLRGKKQAAAKPLEVKTPDDIGLAADQIGAAGSLSRVRRMYVPEKQRARILEGSLPEQAKQLAAIIREYTGS